VLQWRSRPKPEIAMTPTSFERFKSTALAEGFDEVLERVWAPDAVLEEHSHPFAAKALVVKGEMWLTVAGHTQHLLPGDLFELEHGQPHAERYGPEGATYWVARLN
jgi:quercetin dioxygenase-like cupin family protein